MKKNIFLLYFCLISLSLFAQKVGGTKWKPIKFEQIDTFDVKPLKIECSITCEDAELDYYEISWSVPLIDSIAKARGESPSTELHCFVYDSSGLIGFYKGLSTPMQYCAFQTKDSVVEVFFRRRYYAYSNNLGTYSINYGKGGRNIINYFGDKSPQRGPEYEGVQLSVNSTINRKLTLLKDTNTVRMSYGIRESIDGTGMPILGSEYSSVISLDRYYVSLKTGRIATGQKWIDKKEIKKVVSNMSLLSVKSYSISPWMFLGLTLIENPFRASGASLRHY